MLKASDGKAPLSKPGHNADKPYYCLPGFITTSHYVTSFFATGHKLAKKGQTHSMKYQCLFTGGTEGPLASEDTAGHNGAHLSKRQLIPMNG